MKSGGHLSSNLGTVELTVALHRVFDSPYDKLVWDVGHQAYTHKLLTGRYENFDTLRKKDGISGYVRPSESEHDAFISGHSSTSISAALGLAEAMRLNGDTEHRAVAIIGDGAFTGGLAYEGLNNAGKSNENIIVILNHNEMSISKNVGAFAKYLTSIRGNQKYLDAKKAIEELLDSTPVIGSPLKSAIVSSKSTLKMLLYHSTMFEDMGFVYLGPVDGHNIAELEKTLETAKRINKPVFIHVNTVKGKGFRPAEENPGAFHSIPSCGYNVNNPDNSSYNTFSDNFGKYLASLALKDKNICAITAAMKYGTGLQYFASNYPDRFFDVGIAEQHAVTFAAGLASGGKIPVFAVYSSFLQRSYDQLVHDVAIEKTHIVLAVDRAGIVGDEGETHQGIFDIPMLKSIPGTTIYSPSNFDEQRKCLKKAIYETDGLAVVRYPKGGEEFGYCGSKYDTDNFYHFQKGGGCLAISFGRLFNRLYDASRSSSMNSFDMIKLVKIFPVDDAVIEAAQKYNSVVIFEGSSKSGGIGEYIAVKLIESGYKGKIKICAIEGFVGQASVPEALRQNGLDKRSMINVIKDMEK
jgi:1-deoxy-D-xylulose-5-phosphate synthase